MPCPAQRVMHGYRPTWRLRWANFSRVLSAFENDCAQFNSRQLAVKHFVKLLSRRENLREPASPAMLRRCRTCIASLLYSLSSKPLAEEEDLMAGLVAAGCNDTLVGLGRPGYVSL